MISLLESRGLFQSELAADGTAASGRMILNL